MHFCAESAYGPYWSVSTYQHIMEVELQPDVFSSKAELGGIQLNDISPEHDRPAFVSMDPPEHTGPRRAVAPIANRTSLREYENMIRARTISVLSAISVGETFDWVPRISIDLTAMMLATMFNFPQERRHELMYWSDVATANLNAPNPLVPDEAARYAVLQEMAEAFLPYWEARAGGEGFDLITMLANSEATKGMDRAEFIGTLFLLIVGGNDTTRNSMSGGMLASAAFPAAFEAARQDPGLIPTLVSESIRWQTPVIHMRRTALEDAELGGQRIRKGDKVVMWYVSGNMDDAVFEAPETFSVQRQNARRHLAFGAGIHRCVGDKLAEQQLRILWEEILGRGMQFELAGAPDRIYSNFIRGITSMPVKRIA